MPEEVIGKEEGEVDWFVVLTVLGALFAVRWYPELLISFIVSWVLVELFEMYTTGGAIVPAVFSAWLIVRDIFVTPRPAWMDVMRFWDLRFWGLMLLYSFIIAVAVESRFSEIIWGVAFKVAVIPVAFFANILIPWPLTPMVVIASLVTDIIVYYLHSPEDRFWLVIGGGGLKDGINLIYYWVVIIHCVLHFPALG